MDIDHEIMRVEGALHRTLAYASDHQADDAKNLAIALKKLEEVKLMRRLESSPPLRESDDGAFSGYIG